MKEKDIYIYIYACSTHSPLAFTNSDRSQVYTMVAEGKEALLYYHSALLLLTYYFYIFQIFNEQ